LGAVVAVDGEVGFTLILSCKGWRAGLLAHWLGPDSAGASPKFCSFRPPFYSANFFISVRLLAYLTDFYQM
jgi:hypothetical protein